MMLANLIPPYIVPTEPPKTRFEHLKPGELFIWKTGSFSRSVCLKVVQHHPEKYGTAVKEGWCFVHGDESGRIKWPDEKEGYKLPVERV